MKRITIFLIALTVLAAMVTSAEASRFRDLLRSRSVSAERSSMSNESTLTPAEARKELEILFAELKTDSNKLTDVHLVQAKKELTKATADLLKTLQRDESKEAAADWMTTLNLAELEKTLSDPAPKREVLNTVWSSLNSDKKGVKNLKFAPLKAALRRYQTLEGHLNNKNFDAQIATVCGGILKYVDEYAKNPAYANPLSNTIGWLEDVSLVEPRTKKVADLLRVVFSGVNFHASFGAEFIAAGFSENRTETVDIDENFDGTRLTGTGTLKLKSIAKLGNSRDGAEIITVVDAELESFAEGSHPPVRFDSTTTGTLHGEKGIFFRKDSITTSSAIASADLDATLSNIRINGCCLIKLIARQQIQEKQGESKAKAERRTANRLGKRIDETIDEKITELNENYQTKVRQPLTEAGLFPRVWSISSTEQAVSFDALVADSSQPSAINPAPQLNGTPEVAVQIHQSLLNNAAALALTGRTVDEESSETIKKRLETVRNFLNIPEDKDSKPVKMTFASNNPVEVKFDGGKVFAVIQLDSIQVGGDKDRAYTISLEYNLTTENGKVFLEQVKLEAFPAGFDKSKGQLNAFQIGIQNGITKRLALKDKSGNPQKKVELSPLELGGRWKDKGKLFPSFATTQDGWLSFGLNWK
jgi:hypothetical protein